MAITDYLSNKVKAWRAEVWDGLIRALDARFKPLEEQLDIQRATTDAIVQRGLNVIEQELAPVVDAGNVQLDAITQIKADAQTILNLISEKQNLGIPITDIVGLFSRLAALDEGLAATLSATEVAQAIASAKNELLNGAPGALDTLKELAAALGDDEHFAATVSAALANRIRFDAAQTLTTTQKAQACANFGLDAICSSVLDKAGDREAPIFIRTGLTTVSLRAGLTYGVAGKLYKLESDLALTMPAFSSLGVDYFVWANADGTIAINTSASSSPTMNARLLGGFHYAAGGPATGYNTGGDTTPQIWGASLYDLKFRPACPDPRGMAKDPLGWGCMYHLGVNHITDGPSRYGVTIADGSAPPKIPLEFGGNGSTTYSSGNWWNFAEALASHGLRLPTYQEFAVMAFGVKENIARGNDPITTGLATTNTGSSNPDHYFTSKYGFNMTGTLYVWGDEFGGPDAGMVWENTNGARGQVYQQSNAVLLGAYWGDTVNAGSRASFWSHAPSDQNAAFGARGRCGHFCVE